MKRMETKNDLTRRGFIKTAAIGVGATALAGLGAKETKAISPTLIPNPDYEADVVVAGAGPTGLPAAVEAAEHGASVIMIDKNFDIGGYGVIAWGGFGVGGGTRLQKELGIMDSADLVFKDLTNYKDDEFKKNDRALVRAFADNNADTVQWLEERGVKFLDISTPAARGMSARRSHAVYWNEEGTVRSPGLLYARSPKGKSSGAGIMRPLEAIARAKGVQFLLEHKLTRIIREKPLEGKVLGIEAEYKGRKLYIYARKGVIIATGGPKGNVQLRRVFDPRLTEEYQATGEPWAFDTGEGIIAAQDIGAQLCSDKGIDAAWLVKRVALGCRYAGNYRATGFLPGSPAYALQRAEGIAVMDYQNCIFVKKSGLRFVNDFEGDIPFCDAAMADGGGPIWAIFDADAAKREQLHLSPPKVDPELFFSGETIAELAGRIHVPASALEETVTKYNSYVDAGKDPEFGKPTPKYKIQSAPFYAAWATPVLHDTRAGLRINGLSQVIDIHGRVIPGLYAGGEAAGGLSVLGMPRAVIQGRIAGRHAARLKPDG